MPETPKIEVKTLDDLTPDPNNANKHTVRGHQLVENSIRRRGVGRGILAVGKDTEQPVIMAGNLTAEKARDAGIKEVIFVHTTGEQMVVTVRDDLAPGSAEAVALGIEDNEAAKKSYNPDMDIVAALMSDEDGAMAALRAEDKVFNSMLEDMGIITPDFQPVSADEQGRLDQKKPITCPECGAEFTPK